MAIIVLQHSLSVPHRHHPIIEDYVALRVRYAYIISIIRRWLPRSRPCPSTGSLSAGTGDGCASRFPSIAFRSVAARPPASFARVPSRFHRFAPGARLHSLPLAGQLPSERLVVVAPRCTGVAPPHSIRACRDHPYTATGHVLRNLLPQNCSGHHPSLRGRGIPCPGFQIATYPRR